MSKFELGAFRPDATSPVNCDSNKKGAQMRWVPFLRGVPIVRDSQREAFVDLARKAVILHPNLSAQERLGDLLLATGEYDEAVQVLSTARITFPSEPKLYLMLADAYLRKKQPDLAWSILQQIPMTQENDSHLSIDHLTLSLRTLVRLEAFDDAASVATDLLKIDPVNNRALQYLAGVSRIRGNPEIVINLLQAALAHQPGNTTAYYLLALTYAILNRSEEARAMMNLHEFIKIIDLGTPGGYQNALAFETALAGEIASDETLKPDPAGTATEGGFHTDFFLPHSGEQVAICDLISLIQSQVACFAAELIGSPSTPFVERRPQQASLNAWAVVHPFNGRQIPHIHPAGWLSGVYYVSMPKGSLQGARAGNLVLGPVDEELKLDPPWGIREISPVPGRLILFPSYIPHATIPSGSPENRICVAFDVIPLLDPT